MSDVEGSGIAST